MIKALHTLSRIFDRAGELLCLVMVLTMVFVTGAQIVFRVFFTALTWSEELTRYLLAWSSFIGASCVYRHAGHINITLIQDHMPPAARRAVKILVHCICAVFFGLMIYYGIAYAYQMRRQLSPAMRIPMCWMYASIPFGGGLLLLHAVDALMTTLFGSKGDAA